MRIPFPPLVMSCLLLAGCHTTFSNKEELCRLTVTVPVAEYESSVDKYCKFLRDEMNTDPYLEGGESIRNGRITYVLRGYKFSDRDVQFMQILKLQKKCRALEKENENLKIELNKKAE